jgi:serine/threonine protein kinase
MTRQDFEQDLLRRWFPNNGGEVLTSFTENDIRGIADVLSRCARKRWSRVPRLYSILRKIGHLDTLDAFIDGDITDVYFPFSKSTLPEALCDHSARLRFLDLQHLVYNTEALNLERHASHGHFNDSTEVPLKKIGELGKGGFGFVDRVVSTISHQEYARKLILRGRTFKKDKQVLRDFTKELSNLKQLSHKHLVELVGSYTDRKFVAIVMLPVADTNLQTFLERTNLNETARSFLRPFFGCLTSALCYLHDNRIRHKDIKPSNVLIKDDQVYFTDFGTALDWSDRDSSTTSTTPPTTPRYCAPEVMAYTQRNSASDIWSFGCVFLEMWTVLRSHTLEELRAHMIAHGTGTRDFHSNLEAIAGWIDIVRSSSGPSSDLVPSIWIEHMLRQKPTERWNVHILEDHIGEACVDPHIQHSFRGMCCLELDDDTLGSTWSAAEDEEEPSREPHLSLQHVQDSTRLGAASEIPVPSTKTYEHASPPAPYVEDESDSLAQGTKACKDEKPIQRSDDMSGNMPRRSLIENESPLPALISSVSSCGIEDNDSISSLIDGITVPSQHLDSLDTLGRLAFDDRFESQLAELPERPQTDAEHSDAKYSVFCPYRCGTVLTGVNAIKNLIQHLKAQACAGSKSSRVQPRYPCPIGSCGMQYSQSKMLRLHMQRRHDAPPVIQQVSLPPSIATGWNVKDTQTLMPRELTFRESAVATNFEIHARTCLHCRDPLEVYLWKSELCQMGLRCARKLLELVFEFGGEVFANVIGLATQEIISESIHKVDMPLSHFRQIRSLFKAIEHSSHDYSSYVLNEDGQSHYFSIYAAKHSWTELHPCRTCMRPLGSRSRLSRNGFLSHKDCWYIVYKDNKHDRGQHNHPLSSLRWNGPINRQPTAKESGWLKPGQRPEITSPKSETTVLGKSFDDPYVDIDITSLSSKKKRKNKYEIDEGGSDKCSEQDSGLWEGNHLSKAHDQVSRGDYRDMSKQSKKGGVAEAVIEELTPPLLELEPVPPLKEEKADWVLSPISKKQKIDL